MEKVGYSSFDEMAMSSCTTRGIEEQHPSSIVPCIMSRKASLCAPRTSGPQAGYITKGDNNAAYDQQGSISPRLPVKKEWVIGKATFYRVPLLGCISLIPGEILPALNS